MPAPAVAKGIILSISLIAALTTAVAANPQIQAWLEEQRQKIAELLRQIGQELDPESRRAAEAFAYEGRTVINDEGLAREARGSSQAAALATGRRLSSPSTIRRVPRLPAGQREAEERRAMGNDYLERRKRMMEELQGRRNAAAKEKGTTPPMTPTFDELVDEAGNLKSHVSWTEKSIPASPAVKPLSGKVQEDMKQVEQFLAHPVPVAEAAVANSSGWSWGSSFANPFGDEYAMEKSDIDRSTTPKPPVPPKIQLEPERHPSPPIPVPDAFDTTTPIGIRLEKPIDHSALSYEEQLAIALSLSEQESSVMSTTVRQPPPSLDEDAELKAAIAASLRDMDGQQAAHAMANAEPIIPRPMVVDAQPLVDLTPSADAPDPASQTRRNEWAELFDSRSSPSPSPFPLTAQSAGAPIESSDELYRATPQLTKARLASHDALESSRNSSLPFDPVREASAAPRQLENDGDMSFYSAHEPSPAPSSIIFDGERDILAHLDDEPLQEGQRTPTSHAHLSLNFHAASSESETFSSMSRTASRAESTAGSEIEVIDVVDDSDVDMLSEEGDGIATPDSWSEVESRDGESEAGEWQQQR